MNPWFWGEEVWGACMRWDAVTLLQRDVQITTKTQWFLFLGLDGIINFTRPSHSDILLLKFKVHRFVISTQTWSKVWIRGELMTFGPDQYSFYQYWSMMYTLTKAFNIALIECNFVTDDNTEETREEEKTSWD